MNHPVLYGFLALVGFAMAGIWCFRRHQGYPPSVYLTAFVLTFGPFLEALPIERKAIIRSDIKLIAVAALFAASFHSLIWFFRARVRARHSVSLQPGTFA